MNTIWLIANIGNIGILILKYQVLTLSLSTMKCTEISSSLEMRFGTRIYIECFITSYICGFHRPKDFFMALTLR
jgi:hypothetical protein